MSDPTDSLPNDLGTLKAMLLAERTRAERLAQIIKEMQRHRFGRRAETLPEDQLLLGFEEVEQTTASDEADDEARSPAEREAEAAKRRANRGSLPSHLPRVEMVVDVEDQNCPCCGGLFHVIRIADRQIRSLMLCLSPTGASLLRNYTKLLSSTELDDRRPRPR
jgi:transposase